MIPYLVIFAVQFFVNPLSQSNVNTPYQSSPVLLCAFQMLSGRKEPVYTQNQQSNVQGKKDYMGPS